jgi:hypothetical protein
VTVFMYALIYKFSIAVLLERQNKTIIITIIIPEPGYRRLGTCTTFFLAGEHNFANPKESCKI